MYALALSAYALQLAGHQSKANVLDRLLSKLNVNGMELDILFTIRLSQLSLFFSGQHKKLELIKERRIIQRRIEINKHRSHRVWSVNTNRSKYAVRWCADLQVDIKTKK